MSKTNIRPMIEVALFATIAYILDLVTQPMSLGPWISLSFKMVPIFLLSFRWGVKAGAMGGLIWGLLQVVTGQAAGGWLTLTQGFLEYFVAFSLIGINAAEMVFLAGPNRTVDVEVVDIVSVVWSNQPLIKPLNKAIKSSL